MTLRHRLSPPRPQHSAHRNNAGMPFSGPCALVERALASEETGRKRFHHFTQMSRRWAFSRGRLSKLPQTRGRNISRDIAQVPWAVEPLGGARLPRAAGDAQRRDDDSPARRVAIEASIPNRTSRTMKQETHLWHPTAPHVCRSSSHSGPEPMGVLLLPERRGSVWTIDR